MTRRSNVPCWFAGASLLGVVACGGGGNGSAPTPPPNQPPAFSGSTNVDVAENTAGTFYTISVSDPDGIPLHESGARRR